jgi:phosphatidylglycerophosphate synthase
LPNPALDRRPIAARRLRLVQMAADWLVRRRASPNAISVIGMLCAMAAGFAFAAARGHPALWLLGAVLVQARLMANLLDGMVAIGRGIASRIGELFNEVPDRVSDTAVLVGLGVAAGRPALGLGTALAAMATAYVRALGKAAGFPSDFCGPGAKQQRMAIVTLGAIWCAATPESLSAPAPELVLWLVLALAILTAGRRLLRLCRALSH